MQGSRPLSADFGGTDKVLILRRPPLEFLGINSAAVSKDGLHTRSLKSAVSQHPICCHPFETPHFAWLLKVRPSACHAF